MQMGLIPIKKTIGFISISVVCVSVFTFLGSGEISSNKETGVIQVNSLTGLPGKDGPILVVKIDDTSLAHPQVGLKNADVVYVEQVEGGLTRLAAVFSSTVPDVIGPVRSARISDIELFSQYGKIAFAFSGAQRKFLPVIASANLVDVGAMRFGPTYYANDAIRISPYAMMLQGNKLLTEALTRNPDIAISKEMGWKFGAPSESKRKFTSVEISWPASRYSAKWSEPESRWLLYYGDKPNLDASGYHLGPENILIQLVSITDSIYKDKGGGVTPFSATVGNGSCYLLRDGGSTPCLWSRPTEESGTSFTDPAGEPIFFAPGRSWFALTDNEPRFTGLLLQDAPNSTSK